METKYITYYRVSTQKQGQHGLGMDSQKQIVATYLRGATPIAEYIEVASGRSKTRKEMLKAIAHAKAINAKLVVATLDRLLRNVAILEILKDEGVSFVCADMPDANELTIGILALLAEYEAKKVSERTKNAFKAKRKRDNGYKPVGNRTTDRAKAVEGSLERRYETIANSDNRKAMAVIQDKRKLGLTFRAIADYLNELGYKTSRGNNFAVSTVKMLYDRSTKES